MFALHSMRPNDVYLYTGHAARSVLTLGLNRGQVANGSSLSMHRLRTTFWTVYSHERMSAFFTGRPSSISDRHIDVAHLEDYPLIDHVSLSGNSLDKTAPTINCAFIRATAEIAKIVETVSTDVFSLASVSTNGYSVKTAETINTCDNALNVILGHLPEYLQFSDPNRAIGKDWQEIQRTHLGLTYHLTKLMMHRPALVLITLHTHSGEQSPNMPSLQKSIDTAISSAKCIVDLTHQAISTRIPVIQNDASIASFIMSACVTLLYNVIEPSVTSTYAKEIFSHVERAIHCLDKMEHVGPTTGKALSVDVMKCAKDALMLSNSDIRFDHTMIDEFPWLNYGSEPIDDQNLTGDVEHPLNFDAQMAEMPSHDGDLNPNVNDLIPADISGMNGLSYWLNGNFFDFGIPENLN
ncbi:hypothetical protein N7453_001531 [Penicillium expansum]|nr:hypothetical protein N7453_001531 [Penicillium expansum]